MNLRDQGYSVQFIVLSLMCCSLFWTLSAQGASLHTAFDEQAIWKEQFRPGRKREIESDRAIHIVYVNNRTQAPEIDSRQNNFQASTRAPYFLTNPFVTTTIGLGGFNPLGNIEARHGQGWLVETNVSFWGTNEKLIGVGLDLKRLQSVNYRYADVPEMRQGAFGIDRIKQRPELILVGISAQLRLLKSRHFMLTLGLGAAPAFYRLAPADTSLPELVAEEYDHRRLGVAVWQDLRLYTFFGHRTRAIRCGPSFSISLTESYSANSDGIQYDTMREDNTSFGLELWPAATACFTCLFGEKPVYPSFGSSPVPRRPAYSIDRYSLRMDIGMGYSHPVGRISDRHPPGFEMNTFLHSREPNVDAGFFATFAVAPAVPDDVLVPGEDESNPLGQPRWLSSTPLKASVGIAITPFRLMRNNGLLAAGFHVGYQVSSLLRSLSTGGEDSQPVFSDYNLVRHGILFGEHVSATWFFTYSRKSHVGLVIRLSLDQVVSFGESVDTAVLKDEADKKYGIELWPSITGGISLAL